MDKSTPFKMPPFTGRNILIFSDGTGQAGGLMPDEVRSNVYKLFRATRCGPDTKIDPDKQLAFYDPGLGSKAANGGFKIGWMRWIYNLLSSATGLGISRNIEDCYAALIYLWRPGDHIFLFGSAGALIRFVVLAVCLDFAEFRQQSGLSACVVIQIRFAELQRRRSSGFTDMEAGRATKRIQMQ